MLAAIASILATWSALAILFTGLGFVVARILRVSGLRSTTRTFWLGWASAVALLQLWCLFLAVDYRAFAFLSVLSLTGWIGFKPEREAWWACAREQAGW